MTEQKLRPFLRWTGSKRWLANHLIDELIPKNFNSYHEPFLGSGAIFFHVSKNYPKRKYYLSDSNEELINCYEQLKAFPKDVIKHLKSFTNSKEAYEKYRSQIIRSDRKRAARFIYLNRTSFNGIYRVNSNGKYNVPYGNRTNVDIVTKDLLINVSNALKHTSLNCVSFEKTIANIKHKDFVFIDPPYTVAHENNGFIEYNQKLFTWQDQIKLKEFIEELTIKGAYFLLTNAYHKSILNLYEGIGFTQKISRPTIVGGRTSTRKVYNEVIITNI